MENVNFELARLKPRRFGAKTKAMSAEQRRLFGETRAEHEESLQAQLERLREAASASASVSASAFAFAAQAPEKPKASPRRPQRPLGCAKAVSARFVGS